MSILFTCPRTLITNSPRMHLLTNILLFAQENDTRQKTLTWLPDKITIHTSQRFPYQSAAMIYNRRKYLHHFYIFLILITVKSCKMSEVI